MRLSDLEPEVQEPIQGVDDVVVVYGGRFQPPHKGHYAVYKYLAGLFGADKTFIGTSNSCDFENKGQLFKAGKNKGLPKPVKSPFTFDEKFKIWTTMFPVPKDKVVQCVNPTFTPKEILDGYSGNEALVMAVGEKDYEERYKDSDHWLLYPDNKKFGVVKGELYPMSFKGYCIIVPMQEDGISASVVRKTLGSNAPLDKKQEAFVKLYGKFDEEIFNLIVGKVEGI
jgi:hypothetical protein